MYFLNNDQNIMCMAWRDRKPMTVICTVGNVGHVMTSRNDKDLTRRLIPVPNVIKLYNSGMGGVDLSDQRRSYYKFHHATKKFYIALFEYLHESSMNNAQVTFSDMHGRKVTALKYRMGVMDGLLTIACRSSAAPGAFDPSNPVPFVASASVDKTSKFPGIARRDNLKRLTSRCFPKSTAGARGRCEVCHRRNPKNRTRSRYFCDTCMDFPVYLCVPSCFSVYHTCEKF